MRSWLLSALLFLVACAEIHRGAHAPPGGAPSESARSPEAAQPQLVQGPEPAPGPRPIADEDLLVRDDADPGPIASLTREQVQRDLALLVYALEHGYGGRRFVPPEQLRLALDGLRHLEPGDAPYDTASFCRDIDRILFQVADSHLLARFGGNVCSSERRAVNRAGGVGRNVATGGDAPWSVIERSIGKATVPIVAITSLPSSGDPRWRGFEAKLAELIDSAPAIVVDLRGNGGGDDTMGRRLADSLYGQPAPSPVESHVVSQTPATVALRYNSYALMALEARRRGEPVQDWLVTRRDAELARFRLARSGQLAAEDVASGGYSNTYDGAKGFRRPIVVLVDRRCGSACESTLEWLEGHPYVTTVGENTFGAVHFGNVGDVVLPESHVEVQIASDFWRFKDGRYVERTGYAPKIRVARARDALDIAVAHLTRSMARPDAERR